MPVNSFLVAHAVSTVTWRSWSFEPGVVLGLAALAAAYAFGVIRLWRTAGAGSGRDLEESLSAPQASGTDRLYGAPRLGVAGPGRGEQLGMSPMTKARAEITPSHHTIPPSRHALSLRAGRHWYRI